MRAVLFATLAGLLSLSSATAAQLVCPSELTDQITRLAARDPQREASDAAAVGDYRPMGYIASGPGLFGPAAIGTPCAPHTVRFRESFGIPGCFVSGCQRDYSDAGHRFVMAYNRSLVQAAAIHGARLCEPAKPLNLRERHPRRDLPIAIR